VGTPLLYTNMVVHADRLGKDLESTLFDQGNHRGLAHIRTLRIDSRNNWQSYYHPGASDTAAALCSLLQAIPPNKLTRFE
jgi:hypothetical protein